MRTTRKILLALVLTLCVAAVLSVCAFAAYNLDIELPAGAVKGDAKWVDSGYSDIDDAANGWIQIGGAADYTGTATSYPEMSQLAGGRFYWNKNTDRGVLVVTTTNLSGNWEEWSVVSAKNPTSADSKKMYAYAAAFVDVTLGYYGTDVFKSNLSGNVAATKEASIYVNGSSIASYNVYKRYVEGNSKASKQWSNFYVTKASYDAYLAKKTELEATLSGTELEDALVEYVFGSFAGYKMARNLKEDGAYVTLAWVLKQLADNGYVFDSIELRTKQTKVVFSTFGMVLKAAETKTLLFDTKINDIRFADTDRGLFIGAEKLKTMAHVTFATDGTYTDTVTEGVVDLRGFTKGTAYKTYFFSDMFQSASGIEEVIWFDSIDFAGTDKAGLIDYEDLRYCSGLKKITVNAPLTEIGSNAFGGCSALTTIDLKGGIASGATVNAAAFTSVPNTVEIIVYTAEDAAKATTAFAGFNVTITNAAAVPETVTGNALTADGFSIRIDDTTAKNKGPALRAEFTLLASVVEEAKAEGKTLADYGLVVFSANTLNNATYNGDLDAVLAAVVAGQDTNKIKRVSAKNGPYVRVADNGDKTFAAAVTGIGAANYASEVYTYAYAVWSDGENVSYTYTTYTSVRTGKSAHSLYDATVFAFRNGIVNSQNFNAGVDLWSILSKGAFTIESGEEKAIDSGLTQGYTFTNGEYTYLDVPYRAWVYNKNNSGSVAWDSRGQYVEETSTTNVLWSILTDGDELVVVYRRDPKAAGGATAKITMARDGYYASAPYSPRYFTVPVNASSSYTKTGYLEYIHSSYTKNGNGLQSGATVYSPVVSEANAAKITALVLDYGVNSIESRSLDNSTVTNLKTIVYPEGVSAGSGILQNAASVEEVIYASDNKISLTAGTQAAGFGKIVDLSGLTAFNISYAFSGVSKIENIILPANNTGVNGIQESFYNTKALKRVWTIGDDVPAAGTVDLRQTKVKLFCKRSLAFGSNLITYVYMPASTTGIATYAIGLSEKDACSQVFGTDLTYTVDLGTNEAAITGGTTGILVYHNALQTKLTAGTLTSAQADNMSKIKFKCNGQTKTAAEWKTYYDEKAEEESQPKVLPFTSGLNINGMETFLSENDYGFFEQGMNHITSESVFSDIKSKGFDYVRIPINFYTIYYEATSYGYTTEELMGCLDTAIELATAKGLYVMIDFHGWFQIGAESDDYDQFLYCWTQVANRYKNASDKVVFELLNEPWYDNGKAQPYLSDSRLYTMQAEAVKIIRNTGSNNATRLVILCTADGNKAWKLSGMTLPDDDNIAVAIHEYEPYNFTHQGFSWAGLSGQTTTLEAQGGFKSATSYDFGQITKFMAEHPNVPIILNEFGMNLGKASQADTETFLTGITSFCKENNIPWAYWQYYGDYSNEGSMSLYRKSSRWGSFAWDENALSALFAPYSES